MAWQPAAEQPFYVNAKDYHRILKRRIARAKLKESLKVARGRRPYLPRADTSMRCGGRAGQGDHFLTAAEIAERERKEQQKKDSNSNKQTARIPCRHPCLDRRRERETITTTERPHRRNNSSNLFLQLN